MFVLDRVILKRSVCVRNKLDKGKSTQHLQFKNMTAHGTISWHVIPTFLVK